MCINLYNNWCVYVSKDDLDEGEPDFDLKPEDFGLDEEDLIDDSDRPLTKLKNKVKAQVLTYSSTDQY